MRELTQKEIVEVSGGMNEALEGAAILLGAGVALAGGPFTIAAGIALGGSIGLSSWSIIQDL